MSRLQYLLATGLYTGFSPIAPGTAGSLLVLIISWFLLPVHLIIHLLAVLLIFAIGVWSSSFVASDRGHDPSIVVIDEIAGMLIALIACPLNLKAFLVAFVAFRLYDILKPFPADAAERLPSGWGIMIDDVVAGIYAFLTVQILLIFNLL